MGSPSSLIPRGRDGCCADPSVPISSHVATVLREQVVQEPTGPPHIHLCGGTSELRELPPYGGGKTGAFSAFRSHRQRQEEGVPSKWVSRECTSLAEKKQEAEQRWGSLPASSLVLRAAQERRLPPGPLVFPFCAPVFSPSPAHSHSLTCSSFHSLPQHLSCTAFGSTGSTWV